MKYSVRAYLERLPIEKLSKLFQDGSLDETYAVNDAILQDILDVLISRNDESGGQLSTYIQIIKEKQKQPE